MKTKWNEKWNENDRTHTANMHTLASHPAIVYSSLGLWYASQPWSSCSCTVTLSRHQSAAPQERKPALSPTWGRWRRRGRHSIAPTYVHGRGSEHFSGSCYQDLSQCDRQWVASSLHLSSSNDMQLHTDYRTCFERCSHFSLPILMLPFIVVQWYILLCVQLGVCMYIADWAPLCQNTL